MKKIFLALVLVILIGCDTLTKKKEVKPVVKEEPVKEVTVKKKEKKVDNSLVRLSKAPCSGDCPVYKVTITKDSIFTFEGEKYTAYTGKKEIKLNIAEYNNLVTTLNNSGFEDLESSYEKQEAKDFSQTTITYQGKSVSVRLWKDAPQDLTNIYVAIEDILYAYKLLE